jgi:four helix bundle protein
MPPRFDHEKLIVYQRALQFIAWLTEILERVPAKLAAHGQLDRASTSLPLNVAEGNGRFTAADRCRFFDIARGSARECAAALEVDLGKAHLAEIVATLVGLLQTNSERRLHEDEVAYPTRGRTQMRQ